MVCRSSKFWHNFDFVNWSRQMLCLPTVSWKWFAMMSQVWNPNYDFEFKEKINIVKGTTLVEYPYAEESRQQHQGCYGIWKKTGKRVILVRSSGPNWQMASVSLSKWLFFQEFLIKFFQHVMLFLHHQWRMKLLITRNISDFRKKCIGKQFSCGPISQMACI